MVTVTGLKGYGYANQKAGQNFELDDYDSGGPCSFLPRYLPSL